MWQRAAVGKVREGRGRKRIAVGRVRALLARVGRGHFERDTVVGHVSDRFQEGIIHGIHQRGGGRISDIGINQLTYTSIRGEEHRRPLSHNSAPSEGEALLLVRVPVSRNCTSHCTHMGLRRNGTSLVQSFPLTYNQRDESTRDPCPHRAHQSKPRPRGLLQREKCRI